MHLAILSSPDVQRRLLGNDEELQRELDALIARYEFQRHVVLVQVPQIPREIFDVEVARKRAYLAYPPQQLLYLSAVLSRLGIESTIVDLHYEVLEAAQHEGFDYDVAWQTKLDAAVSARERPLLCTSLTFETAYPSYRAVCRHLRERYPQACLATGGVNATADPEQALRDAGAQLVLQHEGDISLTAFYSYLRGETTTLPGNLAFLDSAGRFRTTPTALGGNPDIDIRPDYDKIPIRNYHRVGQLSNFSRMNGVEVPYATIMSVRGCRANCSFCGVRGFIGTKMRVRRPEHVIDEMEHLYTHHGIRHFDWLDDDPTYDRHAAMKIYEGLAQRMPDITWTYNNGLIATTATPELLRAMQASGCIGFRIGLESGNPEILRRIRKPATVESFLRFADLAVDFPKMFVGVNIILGIPEETVGQMLDSLWVTLRGRLDWTSYFLYQPIKKTDLYLEFLGAGSGEERKLEVRQINPVRGKELQGFRPPTDVATGYDVLDLDQIIIPSRDQLRELWFTFTITTNFLRNPALFTEDEPRLRNAVRWFGVLTEAYLNDPSMLAIGYYLRRRLGEDSPAQLESLRQKAREAIDRSPYWQFRDRQFGFSQFLDGAVPSVDPRVERFLALRSTKILSHEATSADEDVCPS